MSQRVAVISFSLIDRDARVSRQIQFLSRMYDVTAIGYGNLTRFPSVKMVSLPPNGPIRHQVTLLEKFAWRARTGHLLAPPTSILLALIRSLSRPFLGKATRIFRKFIFERSLWQPTNRKIALQALINSRASIIHANDWESLPIAVLAAKKIGARVVLDLHEYAPLELENCSDWMLEEQPIIDYALRQYSPHVAASITVDQMIADMYAREYGFRPTVVMNASESDSAVTFRPTNPHEIRLIHHGGANPDRKLDLLIKALARMDRRFTLHFMLVGDPEYVAGLEALAGKLARDRIFFHQPVPTNDVVRRIAEFDLGIHLLPWVNSNQKMALPNKFFDFINAGLAVCVGPSPEMARLTLRYKLGLVAPTFDPTQVAELLNGLPCVEIDRMKRQSLLARRDLNAEIEMGKVLAIYEKLSSLPRNVVNKAGPHVRNCGDRS